MSGSETLLPPYIQEWGELSEEQQRTLMRALPADQRIAFAAVLGELLETLNALRCLSPSTTIPDQLCPAVEGLKRLLDEEVPHVSSDDER